MNALDILLTVAGYCLIVFGVTVCYIALSTHRAESRRKEFFRLTATKPFDWNES